MHTFDIEAVADPVARERLRALIPNPVVAERYVPRDIDGFMDLDAFETAVDLGENVLLQGPTGTGKSLAAKAFAARWGLPYVTVSMNAALDPATIWGRWTLTANKSLEWTWTNAAYVVMHGGVLVLEEANTPAEDSVAAFFEVLSDSRILTVLDNGGEVIRVHAEAVIFATMNPGYAGTRPLSPAFGRRWTWPIEYPYSAAIEAELVDSPSLLGLANEIRANRDITTDVGTPSLITFERTARAMSPLFAASRFITLFKPGRERDGVAITVGLYLDRIAAELEDTETEDTEDPAVDLAVMDLEV